jgi:arginyl-tRNA synthetase
MKITLVNPDPKSSTTLVALWAAKISPGTSLEIVMDGGPTSQVRLEDSSYSHAMPCLVLEDPAVVAQALIAAPHSYLAQCLVDECLEDPLSHVPHQGLFVVGDSLTAADIVLACLLHTTMADDQVDKNGVKETHFYKFYGPQVAELQAQAVRLRLSCSLQKTVDAVFRTAIARLLGSDNDAVTTLPTVILKPAAVRGAHYQCSAAMPLFSKLPKTGGNVTYKNPTELAQAIVTAIGPNHPIIGDLDVQPPGFILCQVQALYLQSLLCDFADLSMPTAPPQVCVVDFSSPNIAKEMHVGHLRSTIIGESVCRILEAMGHIVYRVNHIGDWGTQFGMLIEYLKTEYDLANTAPNITDLTVFYKNAKQKFDDDPDFKKASQLNVVALQSGDPDCRKLWQLLCDISRHEFEKVYQRLDVTSQEYGESFYNARIPAVIREFEQAKLLAEEEGGAKVVWLQDRTKYQFPLMLQKSDGGYGYDSTDMAALQYRLHELKADRIIIITDFSQADHFALVYEAGREIGWLNHGQQLEHIGFGTVQGEDGKRFKTRSGDTVRLVDLLDEAVNRMETQLRQRKEEGKATIVDDDVRAVAEAIGYGAVKYYDLRRNPTSNYKFSYDQMLDTKGDTAVYLLFARARLESIIHKAALEHNVHVPQLQKDGVQIQIIHASERNLAYRIATFVDAMENAVTELYPCHICDYVYQLAVAASDFVTQCRVLGSEEMPSRILLCHAVTQCMKTSFDLLGIRHVKRI